MLRKLHIQNYAIIDELEIDFSGKLNIITGETGAGKSIIMGALSLILGERAESNVALDKGKKCFVEAFFDVDNQPAFASLLQAHELDLEADLVIRREINTSGKSRAFVNDSPVNLGVLQAICGHLVDLHQQFDTLELGREDFQRQVMDALAGTADELEQCAQLFAHWKKEQTALQALQLEKQQFNKEFDYNKFLFEELEEANLQAGELESLDQELQMLSNSEGIKTTLSHAVSQLSEGETPMLQQLKSLLQQLQQLERLHPKMSPLVQRLQSNHVELKDIADELELMQETVQFDPARIEQINEKLNLGYKLQKKHHVQTTDELIAIREDLGKKLESVLQIDDTIAAKEKLVADLLAKADAVAENISQKRKKQAAPLEKKVKELLQKIGMPNAQLKVQMNKAPLQAHGADAIDFLFDANKSGRFEPIGKVASGGELSRLMLCIKSLVAEKMDLPTQIFDEIDTGISGEAAKQVGVIMKNMCSQRQVICITHQPQIAGKADAHYFVYKGIKGNSVQTAIKLLDNEERILAIAKMLSGEKPTAAALENAREMVMN
jgi:DNA repair protein RecN (Recombination protein N)